MHGSDPRASGPKASLPPSPSTSTFSEAHFGLLGLQHQHTWAKVWLTWHLYFRSQLYGHFLQEAFPGLLSNLWHPCTPKSIALPLVKLLITDTQGPWVREGRTGPTLFPDVSSTWHPMKEITLASYQQLRPPPTTQGSLGARTVYESTLRTFHTLKAAENWESSPVGVRIPARSPSLSGPQFPHLSSHRLLVSTGSPARAIRSPPLLTEESEQWAAPVSRLLHGQTRFENSDYSLIKPVGLPVNTL